MLLLAYNEPHIEMLAERTRSGDLAVLVGAGSSIAYGYPGWKEFLQKLETPLREKLRDDFLDELRKRDVRTRLDETASYLQDEYPRIFRETFQPRDGAGHPPEWVRLIHDLPVRLLLTTNYTIELEQASQFRKLDVVRWYQSKAVAGALKGGAHVIYLHGRFDDEPRLRSDPQELEYSHVILGEKSYRYAYEHPGTLKTRLSAICQTHTLLVIGASLEDEDFTGTLRLAHALSGAERSYAILRLKEDRTPTDAAADLIARFGCQPLFYEATADRNAALYALLADIIKRTHPSGLARRPQAPDTVTSGHYPPFPRVVHPLLGAAQFEPRPDFRRAVDEFLERKEGGVLALVGIGGAGKTAIVRDALDPILAAKAALTLDGVFVWSFYDSPDAAAFFRNLSDYVGDRGLPEDAKEVQAYECFRNSLKHSARLLIVMDGLEKLQVEHPSQVRVHGSLESTLRHFLLWLAQSSVCAKALITTRFGLPDLEPETRGERVRILNVDMLTRPQARSLLRRGGVQGSDPELNAVLDYFGTHALTVDHLAGVLVNYLDGTPKRFMELIEAPLTRYEAHLAGARLYQVIKAYEGYISRSEPEVRDTLQRVAIFPGLVDARTLAAVFLKPERADRAGALAGKSELDLRRYLHRLVALRLIREERLDQGIIYSIHPAIRDAVLRNLGDRKKQFAGAAREEFEAGLALRPGFSPVSKTDLSFIEDLIFFCIQEDRLEQALALYRDRLGGYKRLGWKLGEYACGERICRLLVEAAQQRNSLPQREYHILLTDLALNLENLGRLDEAQVFFEKTLATRSESETQRPWLHNVAQALVLSGRLPAAETIAKQSLERAVSASDKEEQIASLSWQGMSAFERGNIEKGLDSFRRCRLLQNEVQHNRWYLYSTRGFNFQNALLKCSRSGDALGQADASLKIHMDQGWLDSVERSRIIRVEALRLQKRLDEAFEALSQASEWAIAKGHQEILLYCRLFGARLARDRGAVGVAREEAQDGLRTAEWCGYGLFRVDFLNLIADFHVGERQAETALNLAKRALDLSADPACDYFWGLLVAHGILAQVYRSLDRHEEALFHADNENALKLRVHLPADVLKDLLER